MGVGLTKLVLPQCFPDDDIGVAKANLRSKTNERRGEAPFSLQLYGRGDSSLGFSAEKEGAGIHREVSSCSDIPALPVYTLPHRLTLERGHRPSMKGSKSPDRALTISTTPLKAVGLPLPHASSPYIVVDSEGDAFMVDSDGQIYMVWGWKLFDAGLRKAMMLSEDEFVQDQCRRIDNRTKENSDTQQATNASLQTLTEDTAKRRDRAARARLEFESAIRESLAHFRSEENARWKKFDVIEVTDTDGLRRKFQLHSVAGDGLCLYRSLYEGCKELGLVEKDCGFSEFLRNVWERIDSVTEYREVYKPIFCYTDLYTLNNMSARTIRNKEVNGRIDPKVKIQGAHILSQGMGLYKGSRVNREVVWGDHLELFFILKIHNTNAVVYETDRKGRYLRTQKNLLHSGRPIIYLRKSPDHYDLLLPRKKSHALWSF